MTANRIAVLLSGLALAACVPHKQPLPADAQVAAPASWRASSAAYAPVRADWWQAFGDPQLARLVEAALAHNTDVLVAVARVDEAREQIRLARSALLPTLDASVPLQRDRSLGTTGVVHETVAQPELRLSYELDLWGRLRKLRGAAELQYQASQAERDSVRLGVAATTARAYLSLLSLDAQLQVTEETARSRSDALRVAQDRAELGYTSQLELTQAESEYQAAQQLIPELQQSIRQQENALRLLTGALPGAIERGRDFAGIQPPNVPGALPAELLRRRPDIEQAELQLAAADRYLDARRDEFLPQVQLSAGIGQLYVNALDYDPVKIWDIGASVLAPIYSAGRLESQVASATAQRDQAAYAYRAAALNAFGEVENALSGVQRYAEQIERVRSRRQVLARSLEIAHDRYRGGYSSFLEELDAQRNLFNTELAAIQVRERQLNNLVSLYQALGGGWRAE
jgi:NodT family efflux transporter outer membrane factor (OMF) lipoprotein